MSHRVQRSAEKTKRECQLVKHDQPVDRRTESQSKAGQEVRAVIEQHRDPKLNRSQLCQEEPSGRQLIRLPHEGVQLLGKPELQKRGGEKRIQEIEEKDGGR